MIPLLANAGTPLMWIAIGHLLIGNVVLGVAEGLALHFWKRTPVGRSCAAMIAANYASMIVGGAAISACGTAAPTVSPSDAYLWLIALGVAFWAATVVIEWPFIAWATKAGAGRWTKALRASLLLQAASYAVLIPFYAMGSRVSVLTQTTLATTAELAALVPDGANARVSFRRADDPRFMWTVRLAGGTPQRVDGELPVASGTPAADADFGEATDLAHGLWHVRTTVWSASGLFAEHEATHESVQLALETPFLAWSSRDATVLPGNVVVYALGPHIVLLDLATRRMAVLAQGFSPVVTMAVSARRRSAANPQTLVHDPGPHRRPVDRGLAARRGSTGDRLRSPRRGRGTQAQGNALGIRDDESRAL